MDSFEWNKIAGWLLTAAIAVLALVLVTGEIYHPPKLAKPGYVVEGVEEETPAAGPAKAADKPIEFYLASGSAEKGAEIFKKCGACHNNDKGGPAAIGPNLYGVLGGPHAHMAGFPYSDAMLATKNKTWGWDEINQWLTSPKAYIPGNKMAFAGLSKPQDRADVALFLNSKSDKPLPIPPVPAEAAAAAPAGTPPTGTPAATPPGTPTSAQPSPGPGKAPDVAVGPATADAPKQPQDNIGGPAAHAVGTSKTEGK